MKNDTRKSKRTAAIIQAFAEGKTIEYNCNGDWIEYNNFNFKDKAQNYRIKPMPKYRPFTNAEECWQEMKKHEPFGWIKASHGQFLIIGFRKDEVAFGVNDNWHGYNYIFDSYTFADGTPFGIKEE